MEYMDDIQEADPKELEVLHQENEQRILETLECIQKSFSHNNYPEARDHVMRLIYWKRLQERIRARMES